MTKTFIGNIDAFYAAIEARKAIIHCKALDSLKQKLNLENKTEDEINVALISCLLEEMAYDSIVNQTLDGE